MDLKTKFQIGQRVWTLKKGKAVSFVVQRIYVSVSSSEDSCLIFYYDRDDIVSPECITAAERRVFPSREALSESIFG